MAKKTKATNTSIEEKLKQALIEPGYEPYKIPDNWCWTNLKSICKLNNGTKHTNESLAYFDAKTLRSVTDLVMRNNGVIVEKGKKVILVDGENSGEVFVIPSRGYMGSTFRILDITPLSDEMYIQYFIDYNREKLKNNKVGSAIPHLNRDLFYGLNLPLPPFHEQQRIVGRIKSLFSKLDEAKEKAQKVIDSFETRKAAILHKAFSGELTAKWREENGVGIKSWERKCISECCKLGSGGTPSRKDQSYYTGNIPWIKTGEINWNTINYSEESITKEAIDNSSAKVYAPGAVLVAMYGMGITRGKAAVLGIEAATNQAVCVLQPKEYLLNRYLYFFFMCNYWDIREQAVGGNQLNLSATIIGKLNIDIPDLEEQYVITEMLDSIIEKEYQSKQIAETVIDQIDTMKKAILSRAFRGELGTNDPGDESAIELLKEILYEN